MSDDETKEASWMKAGASKFEIPASVSKISESATSTATIRRRSGTSSSDVARGSRGSASSAPDKSLKELNKRIRAVYIEEGVKYGPDVTDGAEIMKRYALATRMSDKRIEQVFKELAKCSLVDVCFLTDCTGSMSPYIDQVRTSITQIVARITSLGGTDTNMRCAFVGYRDFCDGAKQFEVLDFTSDLNVFKTFISRMAASGGGDGAEDVFGGIEKALSISWNDQRMTRVIFHMADAPCHGKNYHEGCTSDDHPGGDPKGRTEGQLFDQMKQKRISYHFGKIHRITDLMIKMFEAAYGEAIMTFDIKEPRLVEESVVQSVSTALGRTVCETKAGIHSRELRKYKIEKSQPDWNKLPIETGRYVYYEFPSSIAKLLEPTGFLERKLQTYVKVKIAPNPFSEGSERIAYYGRDVSRCGDTDSGDSVIFKEYKHVGKGTNSAARYESSAQIQTIASYFAQQFDKKHDQASKLKFLKVKTISLVCAGGGFRYMTCEKELLNSSSFIRFTNNVSYKITKERMDAAGVLQQHVDLVLAFSHWTHEVTGGEMMIVDLQGVFCKKGDTAASKKKDVLLLTDPVINCLDVARYRPMNLGKAGMEEFFKNHTCNSICRSLKLRPGGFK